MTTPFTTQLTHEFPSLANLTRQELELLIGSWHPAKEESSWYNSGAEPPAEEQAFEALIDSLPEVQALREESQKLLKLSEEKAARNMALRPELEKLRAETQRQYDRARQFEAEWPTVQEQMNQAYKRFAPSTLLLGLTHSASKLHEQSESLASAFAEGLPLEVASAANPQGLTPPESGAATPTSKEGDGDANFVRRYRALRTTYHRRNIMADRWARGAVTWRDD